jgi:hypothetical protein
MAIVLYLAPEFAVTSRFKFKRDLSQLLVSLRFQLAIAGCISLHAIVLAFRHVQYAAPIMKGDGAGGTVDGWGGWVGRRGRGATEKGEEHIEARRGEARRGEARRGEARRLGSEFSL